MRWCWKELTGRTQLLLAAWISRPCGDWMYRYNVEGIGGVFNRKPAGRKARLSAEQKAKIAGLVEARPDPDKDGVVRWRRIDLEKKTEALSGVTMHERTVGKLLPELGYVRLSTRPRRRLLKNFRLDRRREPADRCARQNRWKSGSRTNRASTSKAR